jgi:hypothetical protein
MINRFDFCYRFIFISKFFFFIGRRFQPKLAKYHENPFSTHIPILVGISSFFKIKNVLEIGSGDYSTGLLLNKEIFPDLELLDSYEEDIFWGEKIKSNYAYDKRLDLHCVPYPMSDNIKNLDLKKYDLVFIDDSKNATDRSMTITEVSKIAHENNLIVIHDFENEYYRTAARKIKNHFTFSLFTPCTGVLWQKSVDKKQLFLISQKVRKNRNKISTTDFNGWKEVFSKK